MIISSFWVRHGGRETERVSSVVGFASLCVLIANVPRRGLYMQNFNLSTSSFYDSSNDCVHMIECNCLCD